MAFDAHWANMFGGRSNRFAMGSRPEEEEDPTMPKSVSIDWSSFEKPGPASTRYRQLLDSMPQRPEVSKSDAIGAGLVGFAQNFTGRGKGDETYENLTQRPYHKMMEDFDRSAKAAHEAASLENQDRDDMAKVLSGRERSFDRELGRYYQDQNLRETRRYHNLVDENTDLTRSELAAERERTERNRVDDNTRANKQLGIAGENLKLGKDRLEHDKVKDLLDLGKTAMEIPGKIIKSTKESGVSYTQQAARNSRIAEDLYKEEPSLFAKDENGDFKLRTDLSENEKVRLKMLKRKVEQRVDSMAGHSDISEDF